jgi:hypothetical protein
MTSTDIGLLVESFPKFASAKARLKLLNDDPSEWSAWLTSSVLGYLESAQYGPVSVADVEWLEIRVS